jgi:tol-pal system protein YbgF
MRQEVNQVLEVTGQSERRIREMREQIDRRTRAAEPPPAPVANGDTTTPAPVNTGPAADELLQIGRDQLSRGGNSAARAAFTDLLTRFPESEQAVEAQFFLAEAHAAEGSTAAADSAYARVVTKYPTSTRAPTALYKRGVLAQTAGRRTAARRLFNTLIADYATSDEAELARERLRVMN